MKNRKTHYQNIVNEVLAKHGEQNFTYRLLGDVLNVSKQRAKQIVDYYNLDTPSSKYHSAECTDLKALIKSNEVTQYTLNELHEDRYKKALSRNLITSLVKSAGLKLRQESFRYIFDDYISKINSEKKTKYEMFVDLQAMYPDKNFNFSSLCDYINKRKIPFKRIRVSATNSRWKENRLRRETLLSLINEFLTNTSVDPSLFDATQLHVQYETFAKENDKQRIEYLEFRKICVQNKVPIATQKSLALLKRVLALGIDLKAHHTTEIASIHNAQYPLFAINIRELNYYIMKPSFD